MTTTEIRMKMMAEQYPNLATLISRLDLIPVVDHQLQSKISARVDELINTSVLRPRVILRSRSNPFDREPINQYLEQLYGPQPWKYPLPSAPF